MILYDHSYNYYLYFFLFEIFESFLKFIQFVSGAVFSIMFCGKTTKE